MDLEIRKLSLRTLLKPSFFLFYFSLGLYIFFLILGLYYFIFIVLETCRLPLKPSEFFSLLTSLDRRLSLRKWCFWVVLTVNRFRLTKLKLLMLIWLSHCLHSAILHWKGLCCIGQGSMKLIRLNLQLWNIEFAAAGAESNSFQWS